MGDGTGSVHSGETPEKSSILDEIDKQMSDLQNEIDRFSLKGDKGGNYTDQTSTPTTADTPPPPPLPIDEGRDPPPPPFPPSGCVCFLPLVLSSVMACCDTPLLSSCLTLSHICERASSLTLIQCILGICH